MKALAILLSCLACFDAGAALAGGRGVVVFDEPLEGAKLGGGVSASFDFGEDDPEAGWAWVRVSSPASAHAYERRVSGLRYDAARNEIVYQAAGAEPVVCARTESRRFFFFTRKRAEPTGNCALKPSLEKRDGDRLYAKVVLEVSP